MRPLVAALLLVVGLGPQPGLAAACEYKLGETLRVTGTYVPSGQVYARAFVFALQIDCGGTKELVTVQQSTGNLRVCKPQARVEVVGKLTWNKFLVDGHYEINNPSSVTCLPEAPVATAASPSPPMPASQPAPASQSAPSVSAVPPQGIEGEVVVEFRIAKDGHLVSADVWRSSGATILDDYSIRAVQTAAPFPPVPDDVAQEILTIHSTFRYSLRSVAPSPR